MLAVAKYGKYYSGYYSEVDMNILPATRQEKKQAVWRTNCTDSSIQEWKS